MFEINTQKNVSKNIYIEAAPILFKKKAAPIFFNGS